MSTWVGIQVRHQDGRTGVIGRDSVGFAHRALRIDVEDGTRDWVQLNVDGPDSGSLGWQWLCEEHMHGPTWLPLGDHNLQEA